MRACPPSSDPCITGMWEFVRGVDLSGEKVVDLVAHQFVVVVAEAVEAGEALDGDVRVLLLRMRHDLLGKHPHALSSILALARTPW